MLQQMADAWANVCQSLTSQGAMLLGYEGSTLQVDADGLTHSNKHCELHREEILPSDERFCEYFLSVTSSRFVNGL